MTTSMLRQGIQSYTLKKYADYRFTVKNDAHKPI